MAGWLNGSVIWRKGRLLLPCPIAVARVCSKGMGSISSDPGSPSTSQDNPLTGQDLPRATLLELIYRMMFQGFHNRMHELQVGHSLWMSQPYSGGLCHSEYDCFKMHLKHVTWSLYDALQKSLIKLLTCWLFIGGIRMPCEWLGDNE